MNCDCERHVEYSDGLCMKHSRIDGLPLEAWIRTNWRSIRIDKHCQLSLGGRLFYFDNDHLEDITDIINSDHLKSEQRKFERLCR